MVELRDCLVGELFPEEQATEAVVRCGVVRATSQARRISLSAVFRWPPCRA